MIEPLAVADEPEPTPDQVAEWECDKDLHGIPGTIARSQLNILRKRLEERANPQPAPRVVAPAPRPQPPAPFAVDTETLIQRLANDQSAELTKVTAERLANRLDDVHSEAFYLKLCREVQDKKRPIGPVLRAYRVADRSSTARSKGACFTAMVQAKREGASRG